MPTRIKLLVSLACLATAAGGYFLMVHLGQTGPSYATIFVGLFATVAMWVFPEVTRKPPADAGAGKDGGR